MPEIMPADFNDENEKKRKFHITNRGDSVTVSSRIGIDQLAAVDKIIEDPSNPIDSRGAASREAFHLLVESFENEPNIDSVVVRYLENERVLTANEDLRRLQESCTLACEDTERTVEGLKRSNDVQGIKQAIATLEKRYKKEREPYKSQIKQTLDKLKTYL